MDTMIAIWTT